MENNFNLRKFLVENTLTHNSKQIKEHSSINEEENKATFFKATINLADKPGVDYGYTLYAQDEEGAKRELDSKLQGQEYQVKDLKGPFTPQPEQGELSSRVDKSTIELDGVDPSDYPDFTDAFIAAANFEDGTPLTDDELDQLGDEMSDEIHQMAYDSLMEGLTKREKTLKEAVLKTLNESKKKNTANQLRSIVKQIIKEETMLNESTSNLLAVLEKLQKSEISGQKETFDKSPEKLVNEIKSLLDKYFKGNVKSLPNGNTYWYIKNQEPFLTITGHDDGKGKGLKANISIVKELQKIDDYLKYQKVYDEVMRAYIVDSNLTTTNKFWMFDKLPNQLHSSELGIQTSGQQQPVNERLMKGLTKREKTLKEAVLKALK